MAARAEAIRTLGAFVVVLGTLHGVVEPSRGSMAMRTEFTAGRAVFPRKEELEAPDEHGHVGNGCLSDRVNRRGIRNPSTY